MEIQGRDPGFAKGGGPWPARGTQAHNGGLGQSPQRGPGTEPLMGVRGRSSLKLKAFHIFSYKKAKSLVSKLKKTPMFGPWGQPPGPPIPGSASGWYN